MVTSKKTMLNNGIAMPMVGLGTFPMRGLRLIRAVYQSESLGYRMFDTSRSYHNERELGFAMSFGRFIRKPKREDVFLITKISNRQQEAGNARAALQSSLKLLNTSYVDMYLMHWPYPGKYIDTWRAMEELYAEDLTRSIGVCNCHEHHLDKLLAASKVIPTVNEIELHPLLSQKPLVKYCCERNIKVMAYSPLGRMSEDLLTNEIILGLADKHRKRCTQIILRWDYQHGHITIPKSSHKEHMRDNIAIFDFELSDSEMRKIDSINIDKRLRHNPDTCDYTKL